MISLSGFHCINPLKNSFRFSLNLIFIFCFAFRELLVVGADTVVTCKKVIHGKPKDADDAIRLLTLLSGRTHVVYSGKITSFNVVYPGKITSLNFVYPGKITLFNFIYPGKITSFIVVYPGKITSFNFVY
jgi:predicted house-cleaning NTP pyrophosphatase (Maf/HAM1 superfamily)